MRSLIEGEQLSSFVVVVGRRRVDVVDVCACVFASLNAVDGCRRHVDSSQMRVMRV